MSGLDDKTSDVALEIKDLTKDYRVGFWQTKKRALDKLNLVVNSGEIFGFLGINGAGKTTTIKVLTGIMQPTMGEATIYGLSFRDPLTRYLIGYLPENPYFYEYLTARESLLFYYSLSGKSTANLSKKINEILEKLQLQDAKNVRLREYSKGMRQRLGIAQAIIHDPRIVFLDEPMSGLDPVGRLLIRNIIFQLKESGITVFFSSHILSDVEMMCDRIGLLRKGHLVKYGHLGQILSAKTQYNEFTIEGIGTEELEKIKTISIRVITEGSTVRAYVPDGAKSRSLFEILANDLSRLISLIPQKETLEDYFIRVESGGESLLSEDHRKNETTEEILS